MSERLAMIAPYVIVFTTFNFAISLFYNIYGLIVFKKKYVKLSHSSISKEQTQYLSKIKFVNVHRAWLKKYYKKIRNYSILYFFASEIICFVAMYLTGRCLLVCRIAFFVDIFLLLLWVFLLLDFMKNNKKLAAQHKENIIKALDGYYKAKYQEQVK